MLPPIKSIYLVVVVRVNDVVFKRGEKFGVALRQFGPQVRVGEMFNHEG